MLEEICEIFTAPVDGVEVSPEFLEMVEALRARVTKRAA
jgi:hypothetical protein